MPQLHSVDLWKLHYFCYLTRLKSCRPEMHLCWRHQEPGYDMLKGIMQHSIKRLSHVHVFIPMSRYTGIYITGLKLDLLNWCRDQILEQLFTIPLLSEYTSTSHSVSGEFMFKLLIVTYLPYKGGRQKNDKPFPSGTL